jgi:radical SAM-linked protein
MKLRCKHKKVGLFRYLSGTQLSLIVDEALRRTGYDFEYTKGFNPRIKINFSLPIPVGVASISEWFDVTLKEEVEETLFLKAFNKNIQEELKMIEVKRIDDKEKPVISKIMSYEYKIFSKKPINKEKIHSYESLKGEILKYSIKEDSLFVLTMETTASQQNYFNIGNFVREINIEPITIIKTKTHMR